MDGSWPRGGDFGSVAAIVRAEVMGFVLSRLEMRKAKNRDEKEWKLLKWEKITT